MLFSNKITSEQIVKMTLMAIQSREQHSKTNLRQALSEFDTSRIQELAEFYDELKASYQDEGKALAHLTRFIKAQLGNQDNGD